MRAAIFGLEDPCAVIQSSILVASFVCACESMGIVITRGNDRKDPYVCGE